eukprot:2243552-Rhodomonas_salina.1
MKGTHRCSLDCICVLHDAICCCSWYSIRRLSTGQRIGGPCLTWSSAAVVPLSAPGSGAAHVSTGHCGADA